MTVSLAAPTPRLGRGFFERDVVEVARDLVGCVLVHDDAEHHRLAGRIVETEAYRGPDDLAAHTARGRRTARNEAMWGAAGHAYLFVVYGRNWAFNVVTGAVGEPCAVLVRAVEPTEGLDAMAVRRRLPPQARDLARGPGRLCAAFGLGRDAYGLDLCAPSSRLYVEPLAAPRPLVVACARVGVEYAGEWAERPWRFVESGSRWVSKPPPSPPRRKGG